MRAQGVVVVQPLGEQVADLAQGGKEVGIAHFATKRAVKALHLGILGGFTRLNPMQDDALSRTPVAQHGADELGPISAP